MNHDMACKRTNIGAARVCSLLTPRKHRTPSSINSIQFNSIRIRIFDNGNTLGKQATKPTLILVEILAVVDENLTKESHRAQLKGKN